MFVIAWLIVFVKLTALKFEKSWIAVVKLLMAETEFPPIALKMLPDEVGKHVVT